MKRINRLKCLGSILIVVICCLLFLPKLCPRSWFYTEWHKSFFETDPERHLVGKWRAYKLVFRPTLYEPIENMGMFVDSNGTCILENCFYSEFNPDPKIVNPKLPITNGLWSIDMDTNRWEKRFLVDDAVPNSKFGGLNTWWDYDMDGDYFICWSGFERTNGTYGVYLFKENTNVPVEAKKHKPY